MDGPALAVVLVGACAALLAYSLLALVFSEDRRVSRRLKQLSDFERREAQGLEPLAQPFRERVLRPAGGGLAGAMSRLIPANWARATTKRLRIAGSPYGLTADDFAAIRLLALFGVGALIFVIARAVGASILSSLFWATIFGVLTSLIPNLWLRSRMENRRLEIRRSLPDMLDMLMISVEAGLGFDAAVAKYVRSTSGALSEEFGVTLSEMQAGMTRREALHDLAERTDVPALSSFVLAMVQADIFGISIGNVLRAQSRDMRVRRRQYAEEVAQKAPAKMVFPLIVFILPATIIVLAGPAILSIGQLFDMY